MSIPHISKIYHFGQLTIPKDVRKALDIRKGESSLEMFVQDEKVILRKYKGNICSMTGKVSEENELYAGKLTLSPEGARDLFMYLKTWKENDSR